MSSSLNTVAQLAMDIESEWEMCAEYDALFDGGEFSGPAADRCAESEIRNLAEAHGFTYDQVLQEMNRILHAPVPCPKCEQLVPEESWFVCPHCGYGLV